MDEARKELEELADPSPPGGPRINLGEFPWWLVMIGLLVAWMIYLAATSEEYTTAYKAILPGLTVTVSATLVAFVGALAIGLVVGLGRLSQNTFLRTIATTYIELIRGIPFLVWIFVVAFVFTRQLNNSLDIDPKTITNWWKGVAALTLFYGAFIAEVFRAGIQSVPSGQSEAARSVGMTERQITRFIVLPQAIRNMLPALGNDLIALFKDTALLSIIAVREITQLARLYSNSNFRFRETFFVLTMFYIVITILLSLLLRWYEKRITVPGQ